MDEPSERSELVLFDLKHGFYRLEITRPDTEEGLIHVAEHESEDFYSSLNFLIDYTRNALTCVSLDAEDQSSLMGHVGYNLAPELRRWSLTRGWELPRVQKKALEGIINMHNEIVELTSAQKNNS